MSDIRVGVLGNGQLGLMMRQESEALGIDVQLRSMDFDDIEEVRTWARKFDVITYESENTPIELIADLAEFAEVHPAPKALAAAQDRYNEKRLFTKLEIPVAPFRLCNDRVTLQRAFTELGPLAIAKTRTGGYDGKGQVVLRNEADVEQAVPMIVSGDLVVEQMIDFDFEISVVGVRNRAGKFVAYPATLNRHRDGILRTSIAAPLLTPEQLAAANEYVSRIAAHFDYVGVLALEMFVANGRVIANEMAPRVHNSGHWTIEGAETSQFENHIRAICGLPVGSTAQLCPAAMVNLIGDVPPMDVMLEIPGARPHIYGKEPRPGRKLGHVTVTARNDTQLRERIDRVEALTAS